MNTFPIERIWHDLVKHIKLRWAEAAIFCIFLIAVVYLLLSSPISYS